MRNLAFIMTALPMLVWAGAPGPDSAWKLETLEDSSGFGAVAVLYQDSANTIMDESGNVVTPRLAVRCESGGLIASINWQRFISSFSTEVGFKVDDGRFMWLKWKVDSSEKVTSSPSADDSQKLIDALKSGAALLVEVSPYSQGPETVDFDLAGFAEALGELSGQCE